MNEEDQCVCEKEQVKDTCKSCKSEKVENLQNFLEDKVAQIRQAYVRSNMNNMSYMCINCEITAHQRQYEGFAIHIQ